MPGRPEQRGPDPQSSDTDCSQSREWDHQGCLGHFKEGQGRSFSTFLLESIDDFCVIGLQGLHCILTQ